MKRIKVIALGLVLGVAGVAYAAQGNVQMTANEAQASCCSMKDCCAGDSCKMQGSCCEGGACQMGGECCSAKKQ